MDASATVSSTSQSPIDSKSRRKDSRSPSPSGSPSAKRIKLDPVTPEPEERIEEDNCIICLQSIIDRTVLACAHDAFCFECMVVWTNQSRKCPLCSADTGLYLIHQVRSELDYQKHYLAPLRSSPVPAPPLSRLNMVVNSRRRRRGHVNWGAAQSTRENAAERSRDELHHAIEKRRWVYRHNLYAKHMASNSYTRYRPYPAPSQFASSEELISRATAFLRRELRVWVNLDVEFLTTFVLSLLRTIDIRSEPAIRIIAEFLDLGGAPYTEGAPKSNAEHFAHELYAFLRSPYRELSVYDGVVQYDLPPGVTVPSHSNGRNLGRPRSPIRINRSRSPSHRESYAPRDSRSPSWGSPRDGRSPSPVRASRRSRPRSRSADNSLRHHRTRNIMASRRRSRSPSIPSPGQPSSDRVFPASHGRQQGDLRVDVKSPRDDRRVQNKVPLDVEPSQSADPRTDLKGTEKGKAPIKVDERVRVPSRSRSPDRPRNKRPISDGQDQDKGKDIIASRLSDSSSNENLPPPPPGMLSIRNAAARLNSAINADGPYIPTQIIDPRAQDRSPLPSSTDRNGRGPHSTVPDSSRSLAEMGTGTRAISTDSSSFGSNPHMHPSTENHRIRDTYELSSDATNFFRQRLLTRLAQEKQSSRPNSSGISSPTDIRPSVKAAPLKPHGSTGLDTDMKARRRELLLRARLSAGKQPTIGLVTSDDARLAQSSTHGALEGRVLVSTNLDLVVEASLKERLKSRFHRPTTNAPTPSST